MPQAICCKGTQPAVLGALDPNAYAGCLDDEHRPGVGRVLHLLQHDRSLHGERAGSREDRARELVVGEHELDSDALLLQPQAPESDIPYARVVPSLSLD